MPRTVTTRDQGNLIHTYQDGAQTLKSHGIHTDTRGTANLVPRVLRLLGQRLVARRESGVLEFYYHRISTVKQCKPLRGSQSKYLKFFEFSRVSHRDHPLTKKPKNSGGNHGRLVLQHQPKKDTSIARKILGAGVENSSPG